MHIRFASPEETHALRQQVLRPMQAMEEMEWPQDRNPGSFHIGVEQDSELVAVASFLPERNPMLKGERPYRVRGMATAAPFRRAGLGARLLRFGMDGLLDRHADLVWCHARQRAVPFYARAGFTRLGSLFEVQDIGIHLLMYQPL
ncbi:MAG TPA: GNAT family N-acetyltransferase [Flavobacteriales bacterium]|nr:GNAT family N-acetyltransferase [Flavobacteriales bacterium]HRN38567.1 GNAT family N-acetyltransferase [Flavobacteriales bacterium]HRO38509.1 GNAT family N-acetyltransferase [Flavobacteriales bacterium]HRP80893.1 GNAT family N-acetyltransferase [Flavobacteriales bacterium]HRQ83550.1 GNAT family N-acetyltransferase [Flavobacteriales bacterium]